ncbi:MAG: UxaA family hydrolase, partial [Burkholderiaceae bacterium]
MLQEIPLVLRLNPADDVVIARRQLVSGTLIKSEGITVVGLVPPGHKVATRAIATGQPVRRYNQVIGFATREIRPGEHVHLHNLGIGEEHGAFARDYAFCADVRPTPPVSAPATFKGIVRANGRVATRNYIAILSSVNCSATVSRAIADRFRRDLFPEELAPYPNVDGVIALTHGTGCGMDMGESMTVLRRTMAGYARHANVAAAIFVGLGCEANQIASLFGAEQLRNSDRVASYNMQDVGGTAKAIERGVAIVREMLPAANRVERAD